MLPETAARALLAAAYDRLRATVRTPLPPVLARWADELGAPDGDTPLVGTGRHADRYEALLWSGARHPADPFVVTALLTAAPGTDAVTAGRALAAGEAVATAVAATVPAGPARPDPAVLGCAVVAAWVGGAPRPGPGDDRFAGLLDVAASLMLLDTGVPGRPAPRVAALRAGHPAAAGWLATRCVRAGVTGMPDAVRRTVAVVTGAPPRDPRPVADVDELVAGIA
ncbi:hypothetical protein [Jatrophihabitans endophyticus]|uniref:hypothetical protein n=1 Tax=Jatrophihabitans endophyticus TaxID=1206085 RepID=UPI001160FC1E|nr:hypothetical protein [Jatrophihabitans endophyticus]